MKEWFKMWDCGYLFYAMLLTDLSTIFCLLLMGIDKTVFLLFEQAVFLSLIIGVAGGFQLAILYSDRNNEGIE